MLTDKPFKYADYLSILDEESGVELFEPLIEILTEIHARKPISFSSGMNGVSFIIMSTMFEKSF